MIWKESTGGDVRWPERPAEQDCGDLHKASKGQEPQQGGREVKAGENCRGAGGPLTTAL